MVVVVVWDKDLRFRGDVAGEGRAGLVLHVEGSDSVVGAVV